MACGKMHPVETPEMSTDKPSILTAARVQLIKMNYFLLSNE